MKRAGLAGALLLAVAAPALSKDEPAVPPADANLFVYRGYAEPTVWAPTIKIDGKKLVAVGQNQYTAVHLAPGEYQIQLAWPFISGQQGKKGTITITEGETLYLEVVGVSQVASAGFGYTEYLLGSGLTEHEDASAAIAACCKFKPAKL
jgi:hypothetical protein